jgi:hypothetical protein
MNNAYKISVGKHEGKRSLGRQQLTEMSKRILNKYVEAVVWIQPLQDRMY